MRKPRYLTVRAPAADGFPMFYWQPSGRLRQAGWRSRRLPPDWNAYQDVPALTAAAFAAAEAINRTLDAARGSRPPSKPRISGAIKALVSPDFGGRKFLYVMGTQRGLQKIGISNSPERRREQLESTHGHKLHIWLMVGGRQAFAELLEREAHRRLAAHRREGEWFACLPHVAIAAVGAAMAFIQEQPHGTRRLLALEAQDPAAGTGVL